MEGAASNRVNYTSDSYSKNKEYMHALKNYTDTED